MHKVFLSVHIYAKQKINLVWPNCENGKYLASIMDGSAITSDTIIESYEIAHINEKNP